MKVSGACCALACVMVSSSISFAGLPQNSFGLEVETESWIDVVESGFVDTAYRDDEVYRELDSLFGLGDSGSFFHNTGVGFNGQSAQSTNDTSYVYDETGFEAHAVQHSEMNLGTGFNSGTNNQTLVYGGMIFETDTMLDIFVRAEYSGISGGTLGSYFELIGVEDAPITDFEIENPTDEGFYEIAMQVEVLAGEYFEIYVEGYIGLDALEYGESSASGDISTSVIVRVVPAPGGAGLLAAIGLVGCLRRRGSGVTR